MQCTIVKLHLITSERVGRNLKEITLYKYIVEGNIHFRWFTVDNRRVCFYSIHAPTCSNTSLVSPSRLLPPFWTSVTFEQSVPGAYVVSTDGQEHLLPHLPEMNYLHQVSIQGVDDHLLYFILLPVCVYGTGHREGSATLSQSTTRLPTSKRRFKLLENSRSSRYRFAKLAPMVSQPTISW